MAKPILSAFADEYSAELDVQLKMLQENGIGYIELRGIDGKNISTLTDGEVQILKEKLEAAQKALALASPGAAVFKAMFAQVQQDFKKLTDSLAAVKQEDPDTGAKLQGAVMKLFEKLQGDLED